MENMTTGQRIASRRKLANLSQEAISEQIGVSRQSVSKWESDAGLPDIDNLIALSKIFGVSVGWLIGTESDPNFDPSTGLSDAQLRMVNKVVESRKPKRFGIYLITIFTACIIALSILLACVIAHNVQESRDTQTKINDLENQIYKVTEYLSRQSNENRLLLGIGAKANINDDGETVNIDFYLIPQLFQNSAQAYVTVTNRNSNSRIQKECDLIGSTYYHCRLTLPIENGYQFSFVLANDSGFQTQQLNDDSYIRYLCNLYDSTRYHLDSNESQTAQFSIENSVYTFEKPIASPMVDFLSAYVGYESVDVILYHNDTPIHTQSLRDALRETFGPYMRSAEAFIPYIKAELPVLSVGDILTLEISSKDYNGNVLSDILEKLEVTDSKQ